MRTAVLIVLLVGFVSARPGPDTALKCSVAGPRFHSPRVIERPSCPPSFEVVFAIELSDPGWEIGLDGIGKPDETGRRVVKITGRHKPGAWPQVITPYKVKIPLGIMRKGDYLLDIFYRSSPEAKYRRVQAEVIEAR